LEAQLLEQLEFLRASAKSYDGGFFGEAKRLAHTIRVLVHDTPKSHSLLGQLGRKVGKFYDTCFPVQPGNKATHAGLVMMGIGGRDAGRYLAMGDGVPFSTLVPFDDWWKRIVFIDDRKTQFSRADSVLRVANQDGGSHVDPMLDEAYARLTRENSLGWVSVTNGVNAPVAEEASASIRQVAHELLKSLDPSVVWTPDYHVGIYAGGAAAFDGPLPLDFTPAATQLPTPKVARNAPCPCGSGKEFKKCHGSVRAA
jgi:hypothetical protein